MNSADLKVLILIIPFLLIPSTHVAFTSLVNRLGKEKGYLFGFLFYWMFWCLLVPFYLLGWKGFLSFLIDIVPLFSRPNWLVAALFIFITFMTLFIYGQRFLQTSILQVLIAIPAATINGVCEEILWRGLYVRMFLDNYWLAIFYPAVGFALWHLVPQQIFSEGNKFAFSFPHSFWG